MKRKNYSSNSKTGFTIVEVTLVTAFMAMLMIAIATILANMIALYQKGMTLKTINSAGRNLIAELTASVNAAPSLDSESLCRSLLSGSSADACIADNAFHYVYQSIEDSVTDSVSGVPSSVQYGGVFCTGEYSYVWNTKYAFDSHETIGIRYTGTSSPVDDFKIARFKDQTYRACSSMVNSSYSPLLSKANRVIDVREYANGATFTINDFDDNLLEFSANPDTYEANEDVETNLELYELTIFPVSQDSVTLRAFFSGTFILGTERGNASITRQGDYCDVTNTAEGEGNGEDEGTTNLLDLGSEFNYCGINKFNFAARTAGSGI